MKIPKEAYEFKISYYYYHPEEYNSHSPLDEMPKSISSNSKFLLKARKMKSGEGYIVKRKARKLHFCEECESSIEPNEEYYQLNYYGSMKLYPICENCWRGDKLSAKNNNIYNDLLDEATENTYIHYNKEIRNDEEINAEDKNIFDDLDNEDTENIYIDNNEEVL